MATDDRSIEPPMPSGEGAVPATAIRADPLRKLVSNVLQHAGTHVFAVMSGLSVVFYVGTRAYYVEVYKPLGVRPEEIGLSYSQSLSDAISLLLIAVIAVAIVWATRTLGTAWVTGLVVGLIGLLLILLIARVPGLQKRILEGDPVSKNWITNPLAVRAILGRVVWVDGAPRRLKNLEKRRTLWLGSAHGITVIYDARYRQVLRIPSSKFVFDAAAG